MSNCNIHNVRFYKPKPRAIYCMSLDTKQEKLAVSRSDASLEIWNVSGSALLERTIASSTQNFSIEGLAWSNGRLFSVGLHGLLIEYDLYALKIRHKAVVTGEAAFCLDVNATGTAIAIGTEQGYLNMFTITDDEVLYDKFLDKQEGRILCAKFDHSGDYVVTGSMDVIRVWSVKSGHALHKMMTGRSESKKATIVWCLAITRDFTIISGDSRGRVTFWDGHMGAQLESHQTHKADILALTLSEDESTFYCAGIDPNIVNFERITVKKSAKWAKGAERKIHDHDIRALALHKHKLYSGGVDGYLAFSCFPPKTVLKYPPIMQGACAILSKKARFIMLKYAKCVEVWRLGAVAASEDEVVLKSRPRKLLELKQSVRNDDGESKTEGIVFACISDDGRHILIGTSLGVKLFEFRCGDDEIKPKLTPFHIDYSVTCIQAVNGVFTNANRVIIAPNSGGLVVCTWEYWALTLTQRISTEKEISDTITFLALSESGRYLVAGDPKSNIAVWTHKKGQYDFSSKIPKYQSFPTAIGIHPTLNNLVISYVDNNIIEYDLDKRQLTEFSRSLSGHLPKYWMTRGHTVRNIIFDKNRENIILLQDFSNITVLDKNKKVPKASAKIPKIDLNRQMNGVGDNKIQFGEHCLHSIKKYKHLVHLNWLSDDEMLAVEVNPLTLLEQLPPCLVQNTFGRK